MSKNAKLVEVIFKGERRVIYRNRNELEIQEGNLVVVEAERGQDLGKISLMGDVVKLKRGKGETRSIIRIAHERDMDKYQSNCSKAKEAFKVCKERIEHFGLDMKLIDVEIQHDGSKITFYFTAAQRVDFRELVRDLASTYRTRIELRQIGVRDEAKRICGHGICGRVQCCNSWLTEFEQITTQMAKDQQLSLNPTKISGNCGRLLCCLRYEEDFYHKVFDSYPPLGTVLEIESRRGTLSFINVFEDTALMRFDDGSESWMGPEDIKKGKIIHEP